MEQLQEFALNNALLSGAFVVVLAILIVTEISRATRKFKELNTLQAIRRMNQEDVVILDVSGSADFAKGHILGAVHMPPTQIEAGNQQLNRWKERPVLVCCKNGQVSPQMAGKLVKMGFVDVAILSGGLAQWRADNQPLTTGRKDKKAGKTKKAEAGQGKKKRRKNRDNKPDKSPEAETPRETVDPVEAAEAPVDNEAKPGPESGQPRTRPDADT